MPEPVSLDEAKARLGVRSNNRDAELQGLIPAARLRIEALTGYLLVRRQVVQAIPRYDCARPVSLHFFPVISLGGVQAFDATGVLQDVAGARLVADPAPARVFPAAATSWPVQGSPAGLSVTYTAGYDTGAAAPDPYRAIPEDLLLALYLLIGHYFENHEAVVVGSTALELPLGVKDICNDYRLPGIE